MAYCKIECDEAGGLSSRDGGKIPGVFNSSLEGFTAIIDVVMRQNRDSKKIFALALCSYGSRRT
jgi:hypothetical protein